jgi:putative glutamine amidotransferase
VTARASDGVIEAIEADDGRPILGVQFHPEVVAGDYPQFRRIFDWLVVQARRYRRS